MDYDGDWGESGTARALLADHDLWEWFIESTADDAFELLQRLQAGATLCHRVSTHTRPSQSFILKNGPSRPSPVGWLVAQRLFCEGVVVLASQRLHGTGRTDEYRSVVVSPPRVASVGSGRARASGLA